MDIINKNAQFIFDDKGVIILTDIVSTDNVKVGELVYDGKNSAILNRNNKDYYLLQNIAPCFREKLKTADKVTIIEEKTKTFTHMKLKSVLLNSDILTNGKNLRKKP